jgi:hypothetical protein
MTFLLLVCLDHHLLFLLAHIDTEGFTLSRPIMTKSLSEPKGVSELQTERTRSQDVVRCRWGSWDPAGAQAEIVAKRQLVEIGTLSKTFRVQSISVLQTWKSRYLMKKKKLFFTSVNRLQRHLSDNASNPDLYLLPSCYERTRGLDHRT